MDQPSLPGNRFQHNSAAAQFNFGVVCHWLRQCISNKGWHLRNTGIASATRIFNWDNALGHKLRFLPRGTNSTTKIGFSLRAEYISRGNTRTASFARFDVDSQSVHVRLKFTALDWANGSVMVSPVVDNVHVTQIDWSRKLTRMTPRTGTPLD